MTEDRPDDELDEAQVESLRAFLRSEPVAPVDDVTRRRMVRDAMAHAAPDETTGRARASRLRPTTMRLLAVAAALVVVVGAGVVVLDRGDGDGEPRLAQADLAALRRAYVGDAGPLERDEIAVALSDPSRAGVDRAARFPDGSLRCAAAVANRRPVTAFVTARYGDVDAYVFRLRSTEGPVAVVSAADDCRVLDRVELGG
jgi:hypothetical protein